MSLRDVTAATKFMRVFAGNNQIKVVISEDCVVPSARPDGTITLPVPTINTLDEWNHHAHHELSHALPAHKYHFEANAEVIQLKMSQNVLNIVVDNLAERFEYERYKGRKNILSRGRYDMLHKYADKLWKDPKSVEDEIILGLMAWDHNQRKNWMDYPMSSYLSPIDKYKDVVEYLDSVQLERLMEEESTVEDLVNITQKIMDYAKHKPGDPQNGNSSADKTSSDPKGQSGQPGQEAGKEPTPLAEHDNTVPPGSNIKGGVGDDNANKPDSKPGDVQSGDQPDQGPTSDDAGPDDSKGDQRGSDPDSKRSDGADGDGEPSDSNVPEGDSDRAFAATKPWSNGNVSDETKTVINKMLMQDDTSVDNQCYIPHANPEWVPLDTKPNSYYMERIKEVIKGSKVSKSIRKHLQAVSQTSYQYGTRSGRLSTRSVFRTGSGATNIFKRKCTSRISTDTAICILIDCSKSMNERVSSGYLSKQHVAMGLVVLLSNTLRDLGIKHEVLGFTEGLGDDYEGVVRMMEFINYSERLTEAKLIDRMAKIPTQGNNADAESLLIAASRLSVRKETKKVLLVLSDGNPVGFFKPSKGAAERYLKEVCKHIEDDTDIDLLSIGIQTDAVKRYYKNSQVVMEAEELDKALMTLLRNKVINKHGGK